MYIFLLLWKWHFVKSYGMLYFRYNLQSIYMEAVEISSIWKLISAVLNAVFDKVKNSGLILICSSSGN